VLRVTPPPVWLRRDDAITVPPLGKRPRVGIPFPVVPEVPERTIAVRGHVRNGSAAAVILEPTGVCVVSADRSRRRRVRRFTIPEILSVEEQRMERSAELIIVTTTTEITVVDVDIAQAWAFCREVRERILSGR
jgi:glutamate dehydrogenase/leucine dehydrogenase